MNENADPKEGTHNASELSQELSGTPDQRAEEIKTLQVTFSPRIKADVVFTGQWSGRLVRSAFNAISKGYRRRRHKMIRPELMVERAPIGAKKPKEVKGDGK